MFQTLVFLCLVGTANTGAKEMLFLKLCKAIYEFDAHPLNLIIVSNKK
jgi:hypothetical protein